MFLSSSFLNTLIQRWKGWNQSPDDEGKTTNVWIKWEISWVRCFKARNLIIRCGRWLHFNQGSSSSKQWLISVEKGASVIQKIVWQKWCWNVTKEFEIKNMILSFCISTYISKVLIYLLLSRLFCLAIKIDLIRNIRKTIDGLWWKCIDWFPV